MKRMMCLVLSSVLFLSSTVCAFADDTFVELDEYAQSEMVCESAEDIQLLGDADEAFDYSTQLNGYNVDIHAEAGVFPAGTDVLVQALTPEREMEVRKAVYASLNSGEAVSQIANFDFIFFDAQGNVVEPAMDKVSINITPSVAFKGVSQATDVRVFHVNDNNIIERVESSTASNLKGVSFDATAFSAYSVVVVVNGKVDNKAPVAKSAKLSSKVYKRGGKSSKMTLNVKDDVSGVDFALACFTLDKDNAISVLLTNEYYKDGKLCNYKKGVLCGEVFFPVSKKAGKYKLTGLFVFDKEGNSAEYDTKTLPKSMAKLAVTVKDGKSFTPKFVSVTTPEESINVVNNEYKIAPMTVVIEDPTVKVESIAMTLENAKAYDSYEVVLDKQDDGTFLGYACFYGIADIGTWTIKDVAMMTADGQYARFSKADKNLPKACKNFKFVVNGKKSDKTGPSVKGIKFGEMRTDKSTKTQYLQVIVKAVDDKTGVDGIMVTFSAGKYDLIASYFQNIGKNMYAGEVEIPNSAPSGVYKISQVSVIDNSFNITNYTNEKAKNAKKLTKAMKKLQIEVKNKSKSKKK